MSYDDRYEGDDNLIDESVNKILL